MMSEMINLIMERAVLLGIYFFFYFPIGAGAIGYYVGNAQPAPEVIEQFLRKQRFPLSLICGTSADSIARLLASNPKSAKSARMLGGLLAVGFAGVILMHTVNNVAHPSIVLADAALALIHFFVARSFWLFGSDFA